MIVLVNQFAASASEILAGVLQDYGRALIVGGAHTHGKGTVQALVDPSRNLPRLYQRKYADLGSLKITIQKFYRINGDSMQYRGVVPHITLPDTMQYLEYGERYIDNSLPWDRVEAVNFSKRSLISWIWRILVADILYLFLYIIGKVTSSVTINP